MHLSDAQLEQMIAVHKARIEELEEELMAREVCCCGESMEGHSDPYSAGHSPLSQADREGKLRVTVEEVDAIFWRRAQIQETPLKDIEWSRGGVVLTPTKEDLDDFRFTGLSNIYFIDYCTFGEESNEQSNA